MTINPTTKNFIILGAIIGVSILVSALILANFQATAENKKSNDRKLSAQEVIHNIATDINQNLTASEKGKESDGYLWWVTDDGYNIAVTKSPSVMFKVKASSDFVTSSMNYIVNQPYNKTLTNSVLKSLKDYGFEKNGDNSSKDEYDDTFFDYILAYQKDDIVCTWSLSPDVYVEDGANVLWSELICSDQLKKNYKEQKPLHDDLGLKDANVTISIDKELDDFFYFNVHPRRTGYYIIARKINGKFIKIHEGQDNMQCSKVREFNIPPYIYGECY